MILGINLGLFAYSLAIILALLALYLEQSSRAAT
jgi:hypothetical protein